ncbi:hypothetical protein [uncultured Clostridium sp.]|uniref:hypothetical protein n=1 Tax=uncultured Clostridium sp. TaxID=59620 RepID=UPI0032166D6F
MELKELFIMGELNKVTRKLVKMNNRNHDYVLDKHFIFKNLALTYKKLKKFEISRYYLNLGLENIESEKLISPVEYYDLQWLNIELNKDTLNDKQMLEIYEDMYKYYKKIDHKRNEYCLLFNIYRLKKEYDNMEELLYEVCNLDFKNIDDAIKEILQDFKLLGDTYYAQALKIVNKSYRNNFMML